MNTRQIIFALASVVGSIINPLLILRDENDSFSLFYSLCSPRYSPVIEIEIDRTQLRFLSTFFPVSFDVSFRRRYVVLLVSGLATGLPSVIRVMEDCG